MKYRIMILILTLSWGFGQCDTNKVGYLEIAQCDTNKVDYLDIDGNVYETIQIGDQLWMAENLKVTKYRDGSEIQYVPKDLFKPEWWKLSTGAYGYYKDDQDHLDTYGNLYNWYAVDDDRGLCMEGWHVPSDDEYTVLTDFLGGESVAGGKMKEAGLEHWNDDSDQISLEATNESGFTGLPAGYISTNYGAHTNMGTNGSFWSSSKKGNGKNAWSRILVTDDLSVYRNGRRKEYGFSIRCLGD